ncbi:MAG: condensation domain-containing protein, partial [Blastocatellia bacterium]
MTLKQQVSGNLSGRLPASNSASNRPDPLTRLRSLSVEERGLRAARALQRRRERESVVGNAQGIPRRRDSTSPPPLSFAQQRLWFLHQFEPDSPAYNLAYSLLFQGSLGVISLEQTLSEIVRRHEVLRTLFSTIDGQPVQIVCDPQPICLPLVDLKRLTSVEGLSQLHRLTREHARRPLDIAKGASLKFSLVQLADEQNGMLVTIHHIVSDGWSQGLMIKEVAALYASFGEGSASHLLELPIQYADFACWQREWLRGALLETQLGYWKKQLGDPLPSLELPTDRPRPRVQTYNGASGPPLRVSRSLADGLGRLCQREDST